MARQPTKSIKIVFIVILVIIGTVVAGSVLWAEYQRQQAVQYATDAINSAFQHFPTYTPQTPTPTYFSTPQLTPKHTAPPTPTATPAVPGIRLATTYDVMDSTTKYRIPLVGSVKDSSVDVSFTTDNILLNNKLSSSYGDFAAQLYNAPITASPFRVSELTFSKYGGPNTFEIWLPKGQGGPWVSGTQVNIVIQTGTAQGSITVTLP
jgi:hypothetical protein